MGEEWHRDASDMRRKSDKNMLGMCQEIVKNMSGICQFYLFKFFLFLFCLQRRKLGHCPRQSCLFIYLWTQLVNFSLECFFSYRYRLILFILHMYHPWEVLHLACARHGDLVIFGDLATINIFDKNGLVYSEATSQLWRHNGSFVNTVLGVGVWGSRNWGNSQPISVEDSNSKMVLCIMTQVIICYIKGVPLSKWQSIQYHLRMRISERNVYTVVLWIMLLK